MNPTPLDHQALRAHTIRRAMLHPDRYLAAVLAEIPDEDLAYAIGALPGRVWQLRQRSPQVLQARYSPQRHPASLLRAGLLPVTLGAHELNPLRSLRRRTEWSTWRASAPRRRRA